MKPVKIEEIEGKTIITTETSRLFRKPKVRRFKASSLLVGRFWNWLELPNKSMVPDMLSFQLDHWKEDGI